MEKGNKEKGRPIGLSVVGLTWLLFERMLKNLSSHVLHQTEIRRKNICS